MAFLLNKAEFLTDIDKNSWKLWTTEWKVVTLGIGFHLLGLYYSPRFARGCKADPRGENRSLVQLLFTQWFTVFTRFSQHQLGNETFTNVLPSSVTFAKFLFFFAYSILRMAVAQCLIPLEKRSRKGERNRRQSFSISFLCLVVF